MEVSYTSIKNPKLGCNRDSDGLQATCHSAAISKNDMLRDPVNYWLGVWAKLIVLSAIKRQAEKQQIDPETDVQKLDWDSIRQEICQRTPKKLNAILGGNACYGWFQKRILAYKNQFPDYQLHNKSVIQQLFQHYAHHMVALQESRSVSPVNLYWEQWHDQPSSGILSIIEKQVPLDISPVNELVEARPVVHESEAFEVAESNAKTCSLNTNAVAKKRTLPEVHMTAEGTEFKRRKSDEMEKKKRQLLSVLWTIDFGHGLIHEISREVTELGKLQDGAWSCEYTLDGIEDKVKKIEITDANVLISSIRCLVAVHQSLTNKRKLSKKVSQMLDNLRGSTINNLVL